MLPRTRQRLIHSRAHGEGGIRRYSPIIVWMGVFKVMLAAKHDGVDAPIINDFADETINRATTVTFPTPLAVAVLG